MPEALGFFALAFPALKRWAFLFRPAGRDWVRVASHGSVITRPSCRASESKNLPHRAPRAIACRLKAVSHPRLGRSIGKPTVSTVGKRNNDPERLGRGIRKPTALALGTLEEQAQAPRARNKGAHGFNGGKPSIQNRSPTGTTHAALPKPSTGLAPSPATPRCAWLIPSAPRRSFG